jgi:hypothetical protein
MIIAEELVHANRTIKIYFDPEPLNPRTEWDNATIMKHWHPRYELGDKRIERITADELCEEYQEDGDPIIAILPLYLLDHSGLSVSTTPFSCRWDSGQIGWAFITESKKNLIGFDDSYTKEMYEDIIKQEVKTYNDIITGEVYGYEVIGKDEDLLESCWGFIGMEWCIADAKAAAENSIDPGIEREVDELSSRSTYASV